MIAIRVADRECLDGRRRMFSALDAYVAEEHAGQAAFLWQLRDQAVHSASYDLTRLADLDRRLDAHLDGLRVAGEEGIDACRTALAEPGPGEVFTRAFLAIDRWDLREVSRLIDLADGSSGLAGAFAAALGFSPVAAVRRLVPGLLSPELPPVLHRLGIAGWAAHRCDPGDVLVGAVSAGEPALCARACRAAGELARVDLLAAVQGAMRSDEEAVAFWAAWSAVLLGDGQAVPALWGIATDAGRFAARAADLAARRVPPAQAVESIHKLSAAGEDQGPALRAAAALGDPALVPWLFAEMRVPGWARRAGHAFSRMTGIDLVESGLDAPLPSSVRQGPSDDPEEEDVSMDPDEDLPFPDADRIEALWQRTGSHWKRGTRYVLGKPVSRASLEEAVWIGRQPARAGAALDLALTEPGSPLFEVRAPANAQQAELGLTPSWGVPWA